MTFTSETEKTSQRLTCLFEKNKTDLSLNNVTNEDDGRGYTCGWAGFTTADEEVVAVVEEYTRLVPKNNFVRVQSHGKIYDSLIERLKLLHLQGSADTEILTLLGFYSHWHDACSNPKFHEAYATVVDRIFGEPARKHCFDLGLKLPVAYAILFDSVIQHGNDSDPDGVPAMIERMEKYNRPPFRYGGPIGLGFEPMFLKEFLNVRDETLQNPHNTATRDEWRKSLPRVDALRGILNTNPHLNLPLHVKSKDWNTTIK